MWQKWRKYRIPLGLALALHLALLLALAIKMPQQSYRMPGPVGPKRPLVQATTIDQKAVSQQIHDIKQREREKLLARKRRVARMQAQARRAQLAQRKAKKRLQQLRAKQQAQAKQARAARAREQQRLAKLRQQQQRLRAQQKVAIHAAKTKLQAERAALAKTISAQKKMLQTRQAALAQQMITKQIQQEQQRLAQMKARQNAGIIDRYKAQIIQAIGQRWIIPSSANKKLSSQFIINLAPGGVVLSVRLLKTSGDPALDRSARVAIMKASPLPVPKDPALFDNFRVLQLTVSPQEIAQ